MSADQNLALALLVVVATTGSPRAFAAGESAPKSRAERTVSVISLSEEVSDRLTLQMNLSSVASDSYANKPAFRVPFVEKEHLMDQYLTVLSVAGYALVPEPDDSGYQLVRGRDGRDMEVPVITDIQKAPDNDQLVIFPFHLKYFGSEPMARLLRSFAPASSRIIPVGALRVLLVTDAARSMRKYKDIIDRLDEPKTAEEAKQAMLKRNTHECPPPPHGRGGETGPRRDGSTILLFALVSAILGFLVRGYLIRRIEGGL